MVGADQHQLDRLAGAGHERGQNLRQDDPGEHGDGEQERSPCVLAPDLPDDGQDEHDDRQRHRSADDGQPDHDQRQGRRPVRLQHVDEHAAEEHNPLATRALTIRRKLRTPGRGQRTRVDDKIFGSGCATPFQTGYRPSARDAFRKWCRRAFRMPITHHGPVVDRARVIRRIYRPVLYRAASPARTAGAADRSRSTRRTRPRRRGWGAPRPRRAHLLTECR